jgi:hypothetical protein
MAFEPGAMTDTPFQPVRPPPASDRWRLAIAYEAALAKSTVDRTVVEVPIADEIGGGGA